MRGALRLKYKRFDRLCAAARRFYRTPGGPEIPLGDLYRNHAGRTIFISYHDPEPVDPNRALCFLARSSRERGLSTNLMAF